MIRREYDSSACTCSRHNVNPHARITNNNPTVTLHILAGPLKIVLLYNYPLDKVWEHTFDGLIVLVELVLVSRVDHVVYGAAEEAAHASILVAVFFCWLQC